MTLDCKNLACPEPVIRLKNALEKANIGDEISLLINDSIVLENVTRFLNSNGQKFDTSSDDGVTVLKFKKVASCDAVVLGARQKVIYLNEDRAGSGEVGEALLAKFLGAFCQTPQRPYAVLCVNKAVNLTTNRANPSFGALKNLESLGVKILSCGACLEAYKLVSDLCVGQISNAYEIAQILTEYDEIKL